MLIRLQRDATTHLHEYASHERNYAMENILRGARADERAQPR